MQKRLVLDALPIAVAYVDREERYALVNRTACEWYRKTENQIIGLSVNDAHGDDFSSLQETLEAVLQDETVIIEDLIRYPDNVSRDVKIYSAPEFGPDRQIRGWYTMTEDISERRKLENLKKEFITTVSHELLTLLTSLFGSISLLRNVLTEKTSGESTQLVDIAHRNCERLMELVSDLLDMEKIETEQIEFDDSPVSIRQLVQEGVELNAAYGDRFGVTFEVAGSVPTLPFPETGKPCYRLWRICFRTPRKVPTTEAVSRFASQTMKMLSKSQNAIGGVESRKSSTTKFSKNFSKSTI